MDLLPAHPAGNIDLSSTELDRTISANRMDFFIGTYTIGGEICCSDIDIAVICNYMGEDYLVKFHLIYKLRRKIDSRIEPVLLEQGNDMSGFHEDILKTGKIIYVA